MATYTNTMRMTGLSGIDTESMVAALMKAEGMKLTKLKSQNQISLWTQSAYQNVSKSLKSFQSSFLNLNSPTSGRMSSSYVKNNVSVLSSTGQVSTGVKVVSSSNAEVGKHTIKVDQLATGEKRTSADMPGKVTSGKNFIGNLADGDKISINLDGLSKDITFTQAEIDLINDPASPSDKLVTTINDKLKNAFGTEKDPSDANNMINKVTAQIGANGEVIFTAQKGHTATFTGTDEVMNKLGISKGASTNFNTSQTLKDAFGIDGLTTFKINGEIFSFANTTTISEMMNTVSQKGIGVTFSFDTLNRSFTLASESTGTANSIKIEDSSGFLTGKAVLPDGNEISINKTIGLTIASAAQDAVFEFDGVKTTRDSNRVTMAGMTMDLIEKTPDKEPPLNITVEKDTSSGFEFIKNFVTAFNTMIDDLNAELRTSRPKKDAYNYYQPLTDEEREAMKDSDIVQWESQAKKGLLYNDNILNDIASKMRSTLYLPVELDNKKTISMYDIGISFTQNFSEQGKLVIDEDKLQKAITDNGAAVATLFTKAATGGSSNKPTDARFASEGLAERINDIINRATSSSGTISIKAGIAGDSLSELSSTMYKTIKLQNDRINDMLEYLQAKETSYYTMFSKMEQAITASNNQMAYLSAQLG
ncbi:MAG: flagellar filament capping protein FliD [Clostridiales bacterium]|nr:flagellar filament capping protein FliD [Clostridiales bacterium]